MLFGSTRIVDSLWATGSEHWNKEFVFHIQTRSDLVLFMLLKGVGRWAHSHWDRPGLNLTDIQGSTQSGSLSSLFSKQNVFGPQWTFCISPNTLCTCQLLSFCMGSALNLGCPSSSLPILWAPTHPMMCNRQVTSSVKPSQISPQAPRTPKHGPTQTFTREF